MLNSNFASQLKKMKKIVLVIAVLIVIAFFTPLIIIPSHIPISKIGVLASTDKDAFTNIADSTKWYKWWPNKEAVGKTKNYQWKVANEGENVVQLLAINNHDTITTKLTILVVNVDTIATVWETNFSANFNPINRIIAYKKGAALKKEYNELLDSLSAFLSNSKNIYGFEVEKAMMTDSIMLSIKSTYNHYPSTTEIYAVVQQLRTAATEANVKITNQPMLHVAFDSGLYKAMVALPIEKLVATKTPVTIKRMVLGKTLKASVFGGATTVENSIALLKTYATNRRLTSPAIPYQMLLTNRLNETDSTRWETKIYLPVM